MNAVEAEGQESPSYARELRDALTGVVEGEVRFGLGDRALYAYDGSIFRQRPIGVVVPRHAADVEASLEVCRRFGAPVFGRGGGTGLAGQTVNEAVCFDFSKYLNEIVELDRDRRQARVQPGVICDQLRAAAGEHGLTFGPDPATHDHATIGGMVGNNSCGTHSLVAGKTVDNVDELEVVTYDGVRMRVGATDEAELERIIAAGGRRGAIYAGMRHIRDTYADVIRSGMPDIPRRVSGYNLDQLLPENGFQVARALVGSESTLALTLQARCRLIPWAPHRATVVLGYPDVPSSADDVPWLLGFGPIGVEFFSEHVVANLRAKRMEPAGIGMLPPGKGWLLVEFGGDSPAEAAAAGQSLVAALDRRDSAPSHRLYREPGEQATLWRVRNEAVGSSRMPVGLGGHAGWPNWEDAAVAPQVLGDYLRAYVRLLDRFGYHGVIFGHWGQGCVHCRIDFDLRTTEGIATYRRFMEEAADLVASFGGALSGEHGDGHGRAELWQRMFPPRLMAAFEEFKRVWDPDGRMNPHKLMDPYPLDSHLREGPDYRPRQLVTAFRYPQDGGAFSEAVGRCFGVGKCRHLEGGVMCPSFMVTREERHSTRGRSRLLQEMADGSGSLTRGWRSPEVKEALDLCLSCKGCRRDCPVQVDVATYKAEFLHHFYAGRPRPRQAYALGLINVWARLASHGPLLANAATHTPLLGDLVKAAGGIAVQRDAPRFASATFAEWARGQRPSAPEKGRVLLWPDTFTNFFRPRVGVAAVEVLEAAGYQVVHPAAALCCGRPLYDYGMLSLARRYLRRILRVLGPEIDLGTPMVVLEPSCLAVFRDELVNLYPDDARARRLAAQSFTLAEFLTLRAPDWPIPRLDRAALVQPHCHHHAVMGFAADSEVLRRMGLRVQQPDAGCCGMAGSFGYEAGEKYRVSIAAGERVLLPAIRATDPSTLIVADGFSCQAQISGGTDREAMHLAEVLAIAMRQGAEPPAAYPETHRPTTDPVSSRTASRGARLAVGAGVLVAGLAAARRYRGLRH
ncbi:FAD-binding and (Fe-S)-binding domain-containing protein [Rugosimonospora africana]|uniref:Dimethylmenaquinone methyltransferase n=1 Tax=Rugosimonospora africana TaxID=556532 RepID=A0A8J3QQW1_9ACTN|nr:FAD-binding and (Fe-S)-binding domain-containing protein [Rugosimonospora africana]GIH15254.1 dimethylmenaquinone methyltransferase [Rugosimonospora africana]